MPPVSREQRLIRFVRERKTRPTRGDAVEHLQEWVTQEQAERAIDEAIGKAKSIRVAPGGRLVYWNAEQGAGASLFATAARVIEKQWGTRALGLRDIDVARPPHGKTAVTAAGPARIWCL